MLPQMARALCAFFLIQLITLEEEEEEFHQHQFSISSTFLSNLTLQDQITAVNYIQITPSGSLPNFHPQSTHHDLFNSSSLTQILKGLVASKARNELMKRSKLI
jgi:hypothetical protein